MKSDAPTMAIVTTFARSDARHIFLTGFMGTGKTSVGKVLASHLRRQYVDLDERIVTRAGIPIVDIFATRGEPSFRAMESEALHDLIEEKPLVVATGGGAVIATANRRLMHASGIIINLTVSLEELAIRLAGDHSRPLLRESDPMAKAAALMSQREEFYADADVRIDTTGKSIIEIVREILVLLKNAFPDEVQC